MVESIEGLAEIQQQIGPARQALIEHPVYQRLDSLAALRVFMEHHVFAVWDFMSLLKALQRKVTCVSVPWVPAADRQACRLINEIVLGEESDEVGSGGFASHFELYLSSMRQCGASTQVIERFLQQLREGHGVELALTRCEAPEAVRDFVTFTFGVLNRDCLPELAAAFTFGREDLLPELFEQIVRKLNKRSGGDLDEFVYYLERHIQLDGDQHGPLAHQLVASVCGGDRDNWKVAAVAAQSTLAARQRLWDGIAKAIG